MYRNSRVELLRIFAIVAITLSHLAINTPILKNGGVNETIGNFFIVGGRVGVNIFALITGYFLCNSQRSVKSILKLWLQAFFYSVLLYFISIFLLKDSFNSIEMLSYFMPVSFKKWWYVSAVIGLYLIVPIINILIAHMEEKTFRYFLIVATFMQVILPLFTNQEIFYSDMLWLVYLYFIAAYIKLYMKKQLKKCYAKHNVILLLAVVGWLIIYVSIIVMGWLGNTIGIFKQAQYFFASNTSILSLIDGILWLLVGVTGKEYTSQIINCVAIHTFSMYLIQSHPFFNILIYGYFDSISMSVYYWLYGMIYIILLLVCSWILDSIEKPIAIKIMKKMSQFSIVKRISEILNF